jgi:hypothetical protein
VPEAIGPDGIEPVIVEPALDSSASVDESPVAMSSEPADASAPTDQGAVEPAEPGGEHEGGSGGEGNPYRMTFTVIWHNADGKQITDLDVVLPPDVPQARVRLLRTSFMKTMMDADARAEGEKMGLEISPMSGEEVQDLIAKLYETPKATVQTIRAIMVPR